MFFTSDLYIIHVLFCEVHVIVFNRQIQSVVSLCVSLSNIRSDLNQFPNDFDVTILTGEKQWRQLQKGI